MSEDRNSLLFVYVITRLAGMGYDRLHKPIPVRSIRLLVVLPPIRKGSEWTSGKKVYRVNAHLVKQNQRPGHEKLIHHIWRRGQNGGNDKRSQYSVFSVFSQKISINKPHLGKKDHQDRQFEDGAKGKQKPQGQGKIFTDPGHGIKNITGIANQEAKCRWENDKIAKGGASDKTKRGNKGKRQKNTFFMPVKAGRDKAPYLKENDRAGKENTADKGELQIKKNPSW